ncbi:hypothetical protein OGZ32_07730 [Lactococcus lactis]|uniref:hypothetical protein n=1 Tax=Lactococcus lactis TaxID=1358 RepID=UPI00071C6C18|nr:hypothetical protein [Lactococcus lactis]MDG4955232.1 hypothetical protein [Lactococcus lactis]MDU0403085.1 hypothetical protein [Lactococcus lactis]
MGLEDLKKINESTENWLKFIEAKLIALLTFESGLSYFILKTDIFSRMCIESKIFFMLTLVIAIAFLVWNVVPKTNNRNNPLYYHSWINVDAFDEVTIQNYHSQIKDLAMVIEKKSKGIKYSILSYTVGMIFYLIVIITTSIGGLL